MMLSSKRLAACAAVGLLTTVAALSGSAADAASATDPVSSDAEGAPSRGGSLTFASTTEIGDFNYHTMNISVSSGGFIRNAVYGSLFYQNAVGDIVYDLAESFHTEDGSTWTLELRDGLAFTDGTPFDAEAVKWTWEKVAEIPGRGQPIAQTVASLTVESPTTLVAELTEPNTVFDRDIIRDLVTIGSPTARQEMGDDEFFLHPVAAGPFMLEEWRRDDQMVLVRNPDFYDAERPYLDEVIIRPIPDEPQRLDTVATGGADFGMFVDGQSIDLANERDLQVDSFMTDGGEYLTFNTAAPPFDDVDARLAVARGLDLENLAQVARGGHTEAVRTLFSEGNRFHVADQPVSVYDPEAAQELANSYAERTGGPIEFELSSGNPSSAVQLAEAIQAQLSVYDNIEVTLNPRDLATHTERVRIDGNFQAAIWGGNGQHPFPLVNEFLTGTVVNTSRYSNPEMDDAIHRAASLDPDEALVGMTDIQRLLYEEAPVLYLTRRNYSVIATDGVGGIGPEIWSPELLLLDQVWVND